MKIREIIEKIEAYHPYIPGYEGCDGYKSGNPDQICTGVACALVPTVGHIRKAAELGCNLLYVHEPSYYMTPDFPEWRGSFSNLVYEEKRKLLEENHIVIYRDHDHTHAHEPDGIFTGVIRYLGWEPYRIKIKDPPELCYLFELPERTVREWNDFLMEKIGMSGTRFIGDPDAKISRIAIVPHLYPDAFGKASEKDGYYDDLATQIIRLFERDRIQAIIPGEVIEWNVLSYIADGVMLGKPMACFNIGHFNFEELGARYAKDWISELIGPDVPVEYIHCNELWSHQLRRD